ncbi:MAG: glycosyltransferase [Actinobacteria bacterium]|nr:glycosyltransferase [Actinomycetota bacterium]
MKIALVCPYAWDRFGGVQSHVRALASALRQRDHQVEVFAPRSKSAPEMSPEPGVTFTGRSVAVPANGSVAPLAFGPMAAVSLRRALKEFDPDVLHLHEPLIPSLSLLALWNSDVPAVGTFHASAEASFGYQAGKPALIKSMKKLAVRTTVSDAARGLIGRYFPGDYEMTPNGVDVPRFRDAQPVDLDGSNIVLFLSRIEPRKGLDVLIEALARVDRDDVTLVAAGTGPEERRCRALAKRLGVEAVWLGRVSEADLPRVFKAASIYCAPGLGGESFGIVLIEAMAARVPVICSDLPGFRAVASDAALVVPPGDPDALAGAIASVFDEPGRAGAMSLASENVATRYDWAALVEHVESLYVRAVGSPPAG